MTGSCWGCLPAALGQVAWRCLLMPWWQSAGVRALPAHLMADSRGARSQAAMGFITRSLVSGATASTRSMPGAAGEEG